MPGNQISIPDKIVITLNALSGKSPEAIKEQLISLINEMINTDFNALIQLLYRIDIDEKNLKQILAENEGLNAASIISELIIKRQLQKIESKKQFGTGKPPSHYDSW